MLRNPGYNAFVVLRDNNIEINYISPASIAAQIYVYILYYFQYVTFYIITVFK